MCGAGLSLSPCPSDALLKIRKPLQRIGVVNYAGKNVDRTPWRCRAFKAIRSTKLGNKYRPQIEGRA